ncbi:MAG: hypothetical protein BWZ10_02743 [candidate division BRC1 bacterium ADurb.BinA364]|nr:MAG: hypothetical protein BWZ10_02743 [candidate division BRC1 bacterium ADurb.BinA364]
MRAQLGSFADQIQRALRRLGDIGPIRVASGAHDLFAFAIEEHQEIHAQIAQSDRVQIVLDIGGVAIGDKLIGVVPGCPIAERSGQAIDVGLKRIERSAHIGAHALGFDLVETVENNGSRKEIKRGDPCRRRGADNQNGFLNQRHWRRSCVAKPLCLWPDEAAAAFAVLFAVLSFASIPQSPCATLSALLEYG